MGKPHPLTPSPHAERGIRITWLLMLVAGILIGASGMAVVNGQSAAGGVFAVLYEDGHWELAQEPPGATETPLYGTDVPTYIPTAIHTPAATWTPQVTPTVIVATPAPTGTAAPTAQPLVCEIGIVTATLNVRPAPHDFTAVIDQVHNPERYEVREVAFVDFPGGRLDEWARIEPGWIAVYYNGIVYADYPDVDQCLEVRFPPPQTAWGVWSGPGASRDETAQFIQDIQAAGRTPAVTVYGDPALGQMAHDLGAYVLARPFTGDHPPFDRPAAESARAWVDLALANLGGGWWDCLVLSNEPIHPTWVYAREWIIAAIERARERGVGCIVPVVWSTGRPSLTDVERLRPAYGAEGITVYWGINLYPADPAVLLADHAAGQWTTYRWELYEAPGDGVIVTEFAAGDGGQRADMADIGAFVDYAEGAFVAATAWYNAGPSGLGIWGDAVLWGRLGELAENLTP